MEIHNPHHPPTTFRQFRREYAMIVLSILTALGFERAAVYVHDRATAQESRARIEEEIAGDLSELRRALAVNTASLAYGRDAFNAITDVLKSPNPDQEKIKQITLSTVQGHISLELPTWERDAWDAAIADQSAPNIDARDLRRYAELYSDARDAVSATNMAFSGAVFDRIADLSVDLRLNQLNGRDAARLIARFIITAQQIIAVQKDLLKTGDGGEKPAAR